ncbi:aldo/keto reductase family protein [Paenibacillus sp. F411]|uniref:Aldo/keto reductase n=1 Tax=Paenibacillus algicola TaxID=2565926 RepID=A0A4P8XQ61_9BACL|nr:MULTISPECIES: aldo/keto reductase family protein [Paenibacillus]MBO2944706.1 aldo/keto reductase family protein [Paenibacillus sp. F411]QCT04663.1 aldo/keto reductase [Paenibacillus algicola]
MEFRRLGASGLKVSDISLGSWLTYGGYVERENAVKSIQTAYGLGVNFFDTANVYERGAAEVVVGETLRAFPRESYVLATKVFGRMGDGVNDQGLSRKHIMEQCDASLKRLGMDYIDIYYCHRFHQDTPVQETLRALDDLVRSGKVLYVGVSMWTAAQMEEALAVADRLLLDRIVVNQPLYNMFDREIEKEIIPLGEQKGIGQVVYSPLAQGLLTGKYTSASKEEMPQDSRAAKLGADRMKLNGDRVEKVHQLTAIANELDITMSQLALAWVLRQQNVSSALVGASRPEQVEENVSASGIKLSEDIVQAIESILTA